MLIVFPIANFILLFLLFKTRINQPPLDWRGSFLLAAMVWGVLVTFISEILSLGHWLTPLGVAFSWAILDGILSLLIWRSFKPKLNYRSLIESLSLFEKILMGGILFLILVIGFIALKAPPNTYDSMTYHMSRVMHWAQNRTLAPYPTNIIRQITYTPWAEYAILHFQILSGSDRFANLIQWFSMLGSIIGVSLIAQHLGANSLGQLFASLLTATIPMGILQGSSTQTDYVTSFWLVCFIHSGFLLAQSKTIYAFPIGAALGLCSLTKGTSYFYAIPFIVLILISGWRLYRQKLVLLFSLIFLITLLLNSGFYTRNLILQKHIIAIEESQEVSNQEINPRLLLSNIVKNLSLHLGTPFAKINLLIEKLIVGLHKVMGMDVMDRRISWDPDSEFHIGETSNHEDMAGNPLHFFLNSFCIVVFVYRLIKNQKQKTNTREPSLYRCLWYLIALLTGFTLFNIYMRWAPWHSRYHLPLFVLFAPFAAVVLSRSYAPKVILTIGIVFFLSSMPWVWDNKTRSFFKRRNIFNTPRLEQYFYNKHGHFYSFKKAIEEIKSTGCFNVGFHTSPDGWEYPYWILLKENNPHSFRFEHVHVKNISKNIPYPLGTFEPCAIIDSIGEQSKMIIGDNSYVRTRLFAYSSVLLKDPDGRLAKQSLLFHFNQFLEYTHQANVLLKADPLNQDKLTRLLEIRKNQLNAAKAIDIVDLNKIYPELGTQFYETALLGLQTLIHGHETKNREEYGRGEQFLLKWSQWLEKNLRDVQKAFEQWRLSP